jgi:hypothetical protein
MSQEPIQDQKALIQIVNNSLRKAQEQVSGLRKTNTRLLFTNIVCSAATTLVAGGTAAAGPLVGEGPAGWRISCIVAAAFAFISAVITAVIQQMNISERLSQGNQCVSRLKDLDLSIAVGSHTWEEITNEYREIVKTYPDHIG